MTRMDVDPFAWQAELAEIRAEQERLRERAEWLKARIETYPTVQPVCVFYRYGGEYRDYFQMIADENPLLSAYRFLLAGEEDGAMSAVGVEVGGLLHDMRDLKQRFPGEGYF
jgi:hypothetical protein